MKLPDFIKFAPFNKLRRLMKAELSDTFSLNYSVNRLTMADLEVMENTGLDVNIDDVRVLEDGTLAYKDSRVLLYIRDVAIYGHYSPEESLPKFHLSNCKTLQDMKEKKRFERYVVSIRKDGQFAVNFIKKRQSPEPVTRELNVCKNCLDYLKYKGYENNASFPTKNAIFVSFSIDEFFTLYPRSILVTKPKYTNADAPLNIYNAGFAETSAKYRAQHDYVCSKCSVDLNDIKYRKFLHVHHINGLKWDDSEENLEVLCIYCHAHEPMSSHMENLPDYKEFLRIYPILIKKRA